MEYVATLRRAWEITWKNKGLWVLGILASCGRGGSGGSGGNFSGYQMERPTGDSTRGLERLFNQWVSDERFWIIVIAVVLLVLVLSLLFLALGVIGQGGLIAAFHRADQGSKVTLGEGFSSGVAHFWRLLGAQLLFGLAAVVLVLLLAIPGFGFGLLTLGFGFLCLVPLLVAAALVAGIFLMFVQMSIVVEGNTVTGSFRRAWDVIRAQIGPVLAMGAILLFGGFVVSALIALPFLAAIFPVLTGAILGEQSFGIGLGLAAACVIAYLPVLIVLQGIVTTFVTGAWTLTYLRLIEKPRPLTAPAN